MVKRRNNDPASVPNMLAGLEYNRARFSSLMSQSVVAAQLYRYAVNRIEWVNLPPYISPILIEQLMIEGQLPAVYKPDWAKTPLLYTAHGNGNVDNQRLHDSYTIRSINGRFTATVNRRDVALLDPRYLRANVANIITYYTELFDEFDKALKSNLRVQKTPVIVAGKRSQRLTLTNLARAYEQGEPFIYEYDDSALNDSLQVQNFNVQYVGGAILVDRRAAWNDCMTMLGIDNANQDKRERLVTDEVVANSDQIEQSRFIELRPREEFAQELADKLGVAVSVRWREGEMQ